jgi:hypothetical protein
MERVREAYKRCIKEALNVRDLLIPHEVLKICVEEELRRLAIGE